MKPTSCLILTGALLVFHVGCWAETVQVRPRLHVHEKVSDCRRALIGRWAEDLSNQLIEYIRADQAKNPGRPLLLNLSAAVRTEEQKYSIEKSLSGELRVMDFSKITSMDDVILETALAVPPQHLIQLDRLLAKSLAPIPHFNSVFELAVGGRKSSSIAVEGAIGTLNLPEAERAAVWNRFADCCKPLLVAFTEAEAKANLHLAKALHWQTHDVAFLNNEPDDTIPLPRHAELPDEGYDLVYDEDAVRSMEGFLLSNYSVYQHSLKALHRLSANPKDPKINTKKLEPGFGERFHVAVLFRSIVTQGPGGYRLLWTYAGDHKIRVVDVVEHNVIE